VVIKVREKTIKTRTPRDQSSWRWSYSVIRPTLVYAWLRLTVGMIPLLRKWTIGRLYKSQSMIAKCLVMYYLASNHSCNSPDFLHLFSWYIENFSGNFFFRYTGSTKISIKISAESPLYWEVPSYLQNHITLPILSRRDVRYDRT
jgi:hypothetical protein